MDDKGRQVMVVASPGAGRFRSGVRRTLESELSRHGWDLQWHVIESPEGLETSVSRAVSAGCRRFLAVGGDGTVSRLASLLYGKPHELGIIPAGTANTMARVLGISMNIRQAAVIVATSRNTRRVDSLSVEGRLCLLNVSAGVSSRSLAGLNEAQKTAAGMFSYVIGAAKASLRVSPCDYSLVTDAEACSYRGVEIHVTNNGVLGVPQFHLYERSLLVDGRAEVLGISSWTPPNILNTALDILLRRRRRAIQLIGAGQEIFIDCAQPMPVQGDGDLIGVTPVTIRVLPRAIDFIVP
ncbi:diacylglycerol kinase catalytic region [Dehalogenimonas lykanthroporepellens BL-DC-9]|nr:diacylglycerol kinase catalytic region [Dehalogenimonas lykanthroporepellens BL-DC-9]